MNKFNGLDPHDTMELEAILSTAFLQITDPQGSGITASANPERNESFEPLPANTEVDKSCNNLRTLTSGANLQTSSGPRETTSTTFKYFITPNPFSSDASNDVFHTLESSPLDITAEDASECLVAFDIIPETVVDDTVVDGTGDVAMPCYYDQDEHTGDSILVNSSQNRIIFESMI